MKVLGIDIGTTTISLWSAGSGAEESMGIQNHFQWNIYGDCAGMERIQDVNKIVEKTREVLEGLLHAYPEVSSIGLYRTDARIL